MGATYAVLMGDIVGSERAPSVRAMHRAFNAAVDAANDAYAGSIASPLTITLGDEFQGLLRGLARAWDVALDLRMRLLLADLSCRFVIGTAELQTPLNKALAWNMMGAGLAAARDKLNDKQTQNAYRFSLHGEPILETLLDAVGDSITQVERHWTPTQLEYYAKSRAAQDTQEKLARKLRISPRSLYKVLRAARADFHKRQSAVVRTALLGLDERYGLQ